jgi:hypothetical protein
VLFMACRWMLNYQYSHFFDGHFDTALEMAQFLGRYTQIALAVSLVLQVFVVNRLIARFGVGRAHLIYTGFMGATMCFNLLPMTLPMAVFSRFVETELRFGLRNPTMQLLTNQFSRALRTRVRAWTMGVLVPVSTIAASGLIGWLARHERNIALGVLSIALVAGYFLGSIRLSEFGGMPPARPAMSAKRLRLYRRYHVRVAWYFLRSLTNPPAASARTAAVSRGPR